MSVAREFHVSWSYPAKVWAQFRKTGSKDLRPQSHHGPIGSVTGPLKKKIVLTIQKCPQTTIEEIQRMLQRQGVRLSRSRVHQIMAGLGCTWARRKAMIAAARANSSRTKTIRRKKAVSR